MELKKKRKIQDDYLIIDKEPATGFSVKYKINKGKKKNSNENSLVLGLSHYDLNKKERELTCALFGDIPETVHSKNVSYDDNSFDEEDNDEFKSDDEDKESNDDFFNTNLFDETQFKKRKPAWIDEEDERIRVKDIVANMTKARGSRGIREISEDKYESSLRERFSEITGTPEWAQLNRKVDSSDNEEEDLQKKTGIYLTSKSLSGLIPKGRLDYKFVENLNSDSYSEGSLIKAIEFNSQLNVALVAGCTKNIGTVTLFQFNGKKNHKIQSIKFPKFPIRCAKFIENAHKFVVGSNLYGRFFVYDIEEGKKMSIPWNKNNERNNVKKFTVSPDGRYIVIIGNGGKLHIFNAQTISLLETTSVPCYINDIAFDHDGNKLYTHGDNGRVYIIDSESRICEHSFFDDGCINGTSIAVSPNGRLLACGSSSGIVNVYDLTTLRNGSINPKPLKSIGALTTVVSSLVFNSTSEILAMVSDEKDNAVKLVHTASLTVFSNFPIGNNLKLKRIQTVAFSPDSKYFAAGNNAGCVYLCRLFHY